MAFALRQYRAGGEFIALREIVFGERTFKPGEVFPWRELGMHEVKVAELWRAMYLDCADPSTHADRLDKARAAALQPVLPVPASKPQPQRHQRR